MRKAILSTVLLLAASPLLAEPSLRLDGTEYAPGTTITVHFDTGGADVRPNGWIGVVPSAIAHGSEATNDMHDLSYQYLGEKATGTVTFKAPPAPGSYDIRMNDTDSNGKEVASVTFKVTAAAAADLTGTLKLPRTTYAPGEAIEASFTASPSLPANAWVGIIPSAIPHGREAVNDQHDIQYRYLESKATGTLSFVAPSTGGSYDLRMNSTDSDGVEIASVTFTVAGTISAEAMTQAIRTRGKLAVYGIRFATGSSALEAGSTEALATIAQMLKANAAMKLRIEGHTDNQGQAASNLELSRKRAESVKTHLVDKHAIAPARLTTKGLGDTMPIGRNDNEAGRAQNRRVELASE